MMSEASTCSVLCCPSAEHSRSLRSVCFFDFPHPNDARYPIWTERTLRPKDWTPSPTSKICSRHFRPSDILTLRHADGSGRTEKRLKYDALPSVFEGIPDSMRPRTDIVPRADSPEINPPTQCLTKRPADSLDEIICSNTSKDSNEYVQASTVDAEVPPDALSNFKHANLNNPQNTYATEPLSLSAAIPNAKKARYVPPPDANSSEQIRIRPACSLAQKVVDGRLIVAEHCAQHIPVNYPAATNTDEARRCCVPGCPSGRDNNYLQGRIYFHAFPMDKHLRTEWIKRVACSRFWQPALHSVVCSLHFLSSDYGLMGTTPSLKPIAIPSQLGCRNKLMRKLNGPCPFSRVCAICGCWRAIKQTTYYKSAARLAFVPFPQNPSEREQWLDVCTGVSSEDELYSCERHFVLADILARFEQDGEIKFELQRSDGILPHPSKVFAPLPREYRPRPTPVNIQMDVSPLSFPVNDTRHASISNVFSAAALQSPDAGTAMATSSSFVIRSATNSTSPGGVTFLVIPNQTAHPTFPSIVPPLTKQMQLGHSVYPHCEVLAAPAKTPPPAHSDANSIKPTNIACCVPGCQNVCQSEGQNELTEKPMFFRFVAFGDPRYRTWTQRLRYSPSWIPDSSDRICSDHFDESEIEFRKGEAYLVRKALPSQLSCMTSLCGFTAADMASGAIGCAVCGQRPPAGRQPKASEKLMFFRAPSPAFAALRRKWVDFCNQQRFGIDWACIGADTPWFVCENHFGENYRKAAEGLGSVVSVSEAIPSLPYSLDVNYTDPKLTTSTSHSGNSRLPKGVFCCVPGCGTIMNLGDWGKEKFFDFLPPGGKRYGEWLRMVRYNSSWVPEGRTRICTEHFPASEIRHLTRYSKPALRLRNSAFPTQLSCMESLCTFTPADMMAGKEGCAVCGLHPFTPNRRLKASEKLEFFRAPSGKIREKWIDFCKLQRSDIDWTSVPEETPWYLCENHFDTHNKAKYAEEEAVPSISFSVYSGFSGSTSDPTGKQTKENEEKKTTKRQLPVCSVPGCRKFAWNETPQVPLKFYRFYSKGRYRNKWVNHIRCAVSWRPNARDVICSRHFSPKNFFEATSVKPRRMRRNALPSQIDCVAEYRALRNSGELVGREAVQTCCVCECRRPLDENDLIPSERLSFFPFPDDNILRDSWLAACRQGNPNLTVSKESVICENHFSLDDLTQLLEDGKEARWVPKSEAVPTFAELPVPVKLKKNNRGIRTRSTNTSGWCTGYKCCVPGCGNRSQVEGKLEKITFHIIPGLGTSSRFCEWMNRIRCAISWKPDRHSRVCSKHFCPEDFVEETSKGKQPRTNYLKKLVVPSRLQCVEKFRSPADLSEPVEISAVHRCCVCGWWRSTREKYVRSEVLTFFPFPSDDDQREQWVNICQEWNPDFVFSEELLVCENHFQLDELTWICVDQVNKQLKLRSDAVPSERCLRFLTPSDDTSARDDAVEGEAGASFDGLFGLSSLIRDADTAAEDASEAGSDTGVCEGRGDVSAYENAWGTYMTDDDNSLMEVDNTDLPVTDIINSICPPLKRRRNVENGLPADEDCTNVSVGSIHGMPSALTFATKDAMEISARFASPARCSTDDALMCKNGTSSSEAACVSRLPGESGSSLPATAADGYRRTDENSRVRSKKKRTNKTGNFFTSNICSECNTRFRKEGMLRLHLLGHTGYADPPERKCPECLKHFDDFPALLKHVDEHGTLLVQCPVCNETCSSGVILVHLHRYHPGFEIKRRKLHQKRLNCDTCGLRFARNFLYRLHQLGHQDKECVDNIKITRKCPECGEMFESLEKLAVHVDVHGKPTKKCPVCNGYYPGMRKHIARYHPHYLAETSCSECGKEYTNESSLRLHLRGHQIRASLDSWTCHKCRLQFPKDSLFVLHKNSHSTAACNAISGAQRCPECDEEFDAMDPLHQHVLTHAVAAQKCPECGHWFPCHRLRKHMKWHHPARAHLSILQEKGYRTHPGYKENYKCLKCGQRFRLRRHLEQHMLGHRHRVPFQKTICVQCGLHFRTHLLCRIHKYEHGGKEIAEDIRNRTTCEECVEEFEDFGALVKHVSVHGRRTEECPVCKGRFHALNSHIQRHHPECQYRSGKDCGHVPYRCGECGKEFEALDAFTGHVVAHRAKSALVARTCSDCGLRFKTDIACRLHKMQHGNGEPTALLRDTRECPECQQNFDRLDELVEHVSEHGRATTKCPECGDWYAVVTAHIRRDHPDYHRKLLGLNKSGSENDRSDEDVDLKPKIQMPRMQRRIRFED